MADVYHTGHHTDLDLLSTTVNVVAHDDYCSNAKMKIDIKAKHQFFSSSGYASWLHCDDSIVKPTAEQLVSNKDLWIKSYIFTTELIWFFILGCSAITEQCPLHSLL